MNIYPSTLLPNAFQSFFHQLIAKSAIKPEQIVVEINEAEVIPNLFEFQDVVQDIKSIGVRIAIDDFGKDASSFQRVLRLESDLIKFDKELTYTLADRTMGNMKQLERLIAYCKRVTPVVVLKVSRPLSSWVRQKN
ncbi:EAL domain-containing protein (putative c-di-GMP-specific phosphodiesterase class I) [Alkalibacillus flavidus]|uniref:EAL domain-containing protein (Putative c-di-GMP-specific phosphodiesterase class I) n=1 Tax=Alkalibacillus flavidus TaxID=546021 RepID=A0ABV2KX89_9BACI